MNLHLSTRVKLIQITCIVGTRPNFVKMAAILEAARGRDNVAARLVHTGQHFSPEMCQMFFGDLSLPEPDAYLDAGGGSHAQQTAEIMKRLEGEFLSRRPDLALVVGDVNSTLAAVLVAAKLGVPVAHVEAGLRSFDRTMPEEINRLATDVLADYLFASEPSGVANLRAEGIPDDRIFFVGNVMIDTLLRFREASSKSTVLSRLGLEAASYAAVTLHRPSNVDDPGQLTRLMAMLEGASKRLPVVFPVHPRTRDRLKEAAIRPVGLQLVPPLGYLDFLQLEAQARVVLTDSGGVQEETTILGVPCLTIRENTERPVTISEGTNRLAGTEPSAILAALEDVLEQPRTAAKAPAKWDGRAAERVLDALTDRLGGAAANAC